MYSLRFLPAQNFFEPQAVKGASVYFMRLVLHDWNVATCQKILRHLRDAAIPSTRLIIFDMVMPLSCPEIKEGKPVGLPVPYPLLANLGAGLGGFATAIDLQVHFIVFLEIEMLILY